MKKSNLQRILFWAICCDLGLFSKRLAAPIANFITDALHIPGGVGTSFSLMFVVLAATLMPGGFSATIMSAVQSVLAVILGMVGSMGALSPIGYLLPGIMIDLVLEYSAFLNIGQREQIVFANSVGAVCAGLTANIIVFHLHGIVLAVYLSVAASSGIFCGLLGSKLIPVLQPIINKKT